MLKGKIVALVLLLSSMPCSSAWGMSIDATMTGFSASETSLFNSAFSLWEETIRDPFTVTLTIDMASLPGSILGRSFDFKEGTSGLPMSASIEINDFTGGYAGWFVDTTPWDNEEFHPGRSPFHFLADPGGSAYGLFDMFTVINHELCHVLGFTVNYSLFERNVSTAAGLRLYSGSSVSAYLTPVSEGTHISALSDPYDLMNSFLSTGNRFYPFYLDLSILADAFSYDLVPPPSPNPVPEPSTLLLFASGLICILAYHRI